MIREEGFEYFVKDGSPDRLGVTRQGRDVNFAVAVPDRKSCSLLLYRKGSKEVEASIPISAQTRFGDIRAIAIERFPMEKYEYNYRIDGEIVADPYAMSLAGRAAWGETPVGEPHCLCSFERFDWEEDRPLEIPYEKGVLYAAHVRGLTMHSTSRVRHKGTFKGVQEKIPYLRELGINQLKLMPVYEFAEKPLGKRILGFGEYQARAGEKLNCWGYGPGYYFAPKASYAATDNPVREFKSLVKALHQNGIELILEFYFEERTNPNLIVDCIKYWVREYHIDGVHIVSGKTPLTILATEPMLSRVKIMSEGFPLDEIYAQGYKPAYRNLAEYHQGFEVTARRLLKGDEGQLCGFSEVSRKNPQRNGVINYICDHNGFTLADLVSYDEKHNEANGEDNADGNNYNYSWNCGEEGKSRSRRIGKLRLRQSRNALVMVFLSQGTPLLRGGDELGNSQQGNNNAYCQDNELGWVCWDNGKAGRELLSFTRKLIAFRKNHPIFTPPGELRIMDYLACGYPDLSYHGNRAWYGGFEHYNRHLGMMYAADYVAAQEGQEKGDDYFYVAYNLHWTPHEFALPTLPKNKKWYVALHTGREENDGFYEAGQEEILKEQKTVMVEERSIVVLVGK